MFSPNDKDRSVTTSEKKSAGLIPEFVPKSDQKQYMNKETGYVGSYSEFAYQNVDGQEVNAVDLGDAVAVTKDENGYWVQP